MPPNIRLPESLGLEASGTANRAAEWTRWYLEKNDNWVGSSCYDHQPPVCHLKGFQSVRGHLLSGKAVSTIGSQAWKLDSSWIFKYECKPMASAPDSPAILTKGDVGAITIELESGELAMESVRVEADRGELAFTWQSGQAGLHSLDMGLPLTPLPEVNVILMAKTLLPPLPNTEHRLCPAHEGSSDWSGWREINSTISSSSSSLRLYWGLMSVLGSDTFL